MRPVRGRTSRPSCIVAVFALLLGCSRPSADPKKSPSAAKVDNPVKEGELTTVTLAPEAEARLGVHTAPVEQKKMPRTRTFGGEVVPPPGAAVTISAPVSGTLVAPPRGVIAVPGATLTKGQPIFGLVLTSNERLRVAESRVSLAASRVEADAAVDKAKVEVESAKVALERAERLAGEQVGSVGALDEAKASTPIASGPTASRWRQSSARPGMPFTSMQAALSTH